MAVDLAKLQDWYRQAMRLRIDELRALRAGLDRDDRLVQAEARAIGRALRGSGGTYGFPTLSEAAALLEHSEDGEVARRVEGLIGWLWAIVESGNPTRPNRPEWLFRAAGLAVDDLPAGGVRDLPDAWRLVSERSGRAQPALARRVTKQLHLAAADLKDPERAAVRLVPEALMRGEHLVPVREDAETITVVTSDPTSLSLELELHKVSGRRPIFAVAPPELIDAALSGLLSGRVSLPSAAKSEDFAGAEGRVLVVDDDEDVRLFIRKALERQNFEVVEAADGIEALEAIKKSPGPFSLALVDLEMPRMTGRELLRELRPVGVETAIPVIIVTGHEELLLELDLMDDGADDYIRKPFDPRLLVARVRATLKRTEG